MGLVALFNQNPYTNYGGTSVAIHLRARVDDETSAWGTRSNMNMFLAKTRVLTARIDTRSTNSGPFLKLLKLYAMLCIFFCHCPSLPGGNISASLSLSHAYHALMVCL
jgi:hypothetical protein